MTTVDAMEKKGHAIVQPLLLAGLLAVGVGTVLAVIVFWLVASLPTAKSPSEIVVRLDGTPLLVAGGAFRTYYTLDGEELRNDERFLRRSGTLLRVSHDRPSSGIAWEQRAVLLYDAGRREDECWYYLHDEKLDGNCYFVDFDRKTKYPLGYIGKQGFQEHQPRGEEQIAMNLRRNATPYSYNTQGWLSLISGDRLIKVDLRKRTLQTLMTADHMLYHGPQFVPFPDKLPKDDTEGLAGMTYYVVRLLDRVVLLNQADTQKQHSFTLPAEVRDSSFTFYELRPDQALLIRFRRSMGEIHYDLDWIDPAGKIARHEERVFPPSTILGSPTTGPWAFAAAVSSPVLTLPIAPIIGTDTDPWPGYFASYKAGLPYAWLPCTLAALVAIGLAWLSSRRQRRYAQPWTAAWMVFIVLGGLPAWLAYRWHRRWPVLAACPACGQLAPRDRLHCAHCGAEFPAPQPKGIEVFAA